MAKSDLHKLQNLASFHVGDIVTSVQKGSLVAGGQEAIMYSTMMGGIGMCVLFVHTCVAYRQCT